MDDAGPDPVVASDDVGPAGAADVAVVVLPEGWVGSEDADSGAPASAPLGAVVPVLSVLGVSADVVGAPGVVAGGAAVVVVEAEEFNAGEAVVSVVLAAAAGVVAATVAPVLDTDAGAVVVEVAVVLGVAGDAVVEVAGASNGAEAGARLAGSDGTLVEGSGAVVVVGAVVLSRVTGIDAAPVAVVLGRVTRPVVVAAGEPDVEAGALVAVAEADSVMGTAGGSEGGA